MIANFRPNAAALTLTQHAAQLLRGEGVHQRVVQRQLHLRGQTAAGRRRCTTAVVVP